MLLFTYHRCGVALPRWHVSIAKWSIPLDNIWNSSNKRGSRLVINHYGETGDVLADLSTVCTVDMLGFCKHLVFPCRGRQVNWKKMPIPLLLPIYGKF